jgi:hypothetical protein
MTRVAASSKRITLTGANRPDHTTPHSISPSKIAFFYAGEVPGNFPNRANEKEFPGSTGSEPTHAPRFIRMNLPLPMLVIVTASEKMPGVQAE